jgi:hypothetical protein
MLFFWAFSIDFDTLWNLEAIFSKFDRSEIARRHYKERQKSREMTQNSREIVRRVTKSLKFQKLSEVPLNISKISRWY